MATISAMPTQKSPELLIKEEIEQLARKLNSTDARSAIRLRKLEDALGDLIYSLPDTYVGEDGTGWLDHWAITRGKPPRGGPEFPAWVIERAKAIRKTP